jgi:hypothetical protein
VVSSNIKDCNVLRTATTCLCHPRSRITNHCSIVMKLTLRSVCALGAMPA